MNIYIQKIIHLFTRIYIYICILCINIGTTLHPVTVAFFRPFLIDALGLWQRITPRKQYKYK